MHKPYVYRIPPWPSVKPEQYRQFHAWFSPEDMRKVINCLSSDARAALIAQADQIRGHIFDLLGSGPTQLDFPIDWHTDFKSGRTWPLSVPGRCVIIDVNDDSDIKVIWELSRHQHVVTLGQAYALTGDDRYALEFKTQILHWIDTNPYTMGANWACSMDVGLRAISWLWARMFFEKARVLDSSFWMRFHRALVAHAIYVSSHIEDWGGIRNNHYLSNGTALALIGMALPDVPQSSSWLQEGWDILSECMQRQVLDDGVDYEMSTAYHRLVIEFLLTPALLATRIHYPLPEGYWSKLEKMFEFTQAMTKPDGEIVLFGDADDGRCQILSEYTRVHINDHRYLLSVGAVLFGRSDFARDATRLWDEALWLLGASSSDTFSSLLAEGTHETKILSANRAFPQGGFYLLQNEHFWLFADFGPRGIPGAVGVHGHNDATSFELAVAKQSFIVDSGTYVYSANPLSHQRFKSTKAHNVIIIDGSEMADAPLDLWVLGTQAQAELLEWNAYKKPFFMKGMHHGFERLEDPVCVIRSFLLDNEELTLTDELEGAASHCVELRFHSLLEPIAKGEGFRFLDRDGKILAEVVGPARMEIFFEREQLAYSYGRYRQGWVFGWRQDKLKLPARLQTKFMFGSREMIR
jgi:hypothetical protein